MAMALELSREERNLEVLSRDAPRRAIRWGRKRGPAGAGDEGNYVSPIKIHLVNSIKKKDATGVKKVLQVGMQPYIKSGETNFKLVEDGSSY